MNRITVDLHGDYREDLKIGDTIKSGDVIGWCNGWPNFSPHRHLGIFEVDDLTASVGGVQETYNRLYRSGLSFKSLNPIQATPDWFDASASGFSYLQYTRDWYLKNMNIDIRNQHWYIANNTPSWDTPDTFHDGTDIGTLQGIYKGSELKSPFNAQIIDKGYTEGGLTFFITKIIEENEVKKERSKRPLDNIRLDFTKSDAVIEFTLPVWTYDENGNRREGKDTPDRWWAKALNLHNGWIQCIYDFGEMFYITEEDYYNHSGIQLKEY